MRIRRLGWAGVEVEAAGSTLVIDPMEDVSPLAPYITESHEPLPGPERPGSALLALVTHLHSDHADPAAIAAALAPDGVLLRPAPALGEWLEVAGTSASEAGIAERGIKARVFEPWETDRIGPFEVTAVPAADGLGDPQLSWVVAAEGRRVFHGGDTLFHGWWWRTKMRRGPFDAAFLPINGPVVNFPHRQPPSPLPAAMDPAQAAAAAAILETRVTVPIHYGALHSPPAYAQVDDPVGTFVAAAEAAGLETRVLAPGEGFELED
jgi:L-ascorbate metabolism protein UlaG (beta-lactamase superfamily)